MTSIRIIGAVLALCFCYVAFRHLRKGKLSYNYLLWWGICLFFVLIFGIFPGLVDWLGSHLQIGYPPILIIIIAVLLLMIKMLTMDIERTKHEYQLRILTQKVAELEALLQHGQNDTSE
ncbi:hypothetical protein SAMN02745704_00151 [Paucidesulfovibrio gracilis DSM 16080]|uniref:DUF2304 domain-containing protein n=1 Tax=Paucidesulfovibrio gracilis DSM 16080 TaxID=1121449 RepID=A0A1T4W2L0_9BACT|nr:DUF2304 domain-containing protein [Paucidesulfovibrio gracilis]SKA71500.1 hypothetical protein SAMN02745704_00151 [Paucidesulfovibrio gracilis DSM 16080]